MQKEKRTKSAETTQQIELEPDYSQCRFFKPPAFFWLIIPLGSKAIFSRKCDNKPKEKERESNWKSAAQPLYWRLTK